MPRVAHEAPRARAAGSACDVRAQSLLLRICHKALQALQPSAHVVSAASRSQCAARMERRFRARANVPVEQIVASVAVSQERFSAVLVKAGQCYDTEYELDVETAQYFEQIVGEHVLTMDPWTRQRAALRSPVTNRCLACTTRRFGRV